METTANDAQVSYIPCVEVYDSWEYELTVKNAELHERNASGTVTPYFKLMSAKEMLYVRPNSSDYILVFNGLYSDHPFY